MAPPRYVAEIAPVREVSLVGAADPDYWRGRLAPEGLAPSIADGSARVLIIAAEMKFKGLRFAECSMSVFVEHAAGEGEAVFLVQAFNSRRFFAWVERRIFHTPYAHASVQVEAAAAARVAAECAGRPVLLARRAAAEAPIRTGFETWNGWIHLPAPPSTPESKRRWFHGRVEGEATVFRFITGHVEFRVGDQGDARGFAELARSGFQPVEWIIRPRGFHAKSKTVRRAL